MGSRANLVLTHGTGDYELYYCHWCAQTVDSEFFWGPDHAVAFIKQQRRIESPEPSKWLDEVWAEGGVLIDLSLRVLLLFGGEDIRFDIPLRRFYLRLQQQNWTHWEIRWAQEGVAELVDYLNIPRHFVLDSRGDDESWEELSLAPPKEIDWIDGVASIRWESGNLRLYPLAGSSDSAIYLHNGVRLLEAARQETGWETLFLDEWADVEPKVEFPRGGFHIDVLQKTIGLWFSGFSVDVEKRIARFWPGWSVTWHRDRYEFQLEVTEGCLRFPVPSQAELEKDLRSILLSENDRSSAEAFIDVVKQLEAEDRTVEVNPLALEKTFLPLPLAVRERIFEQALRDIQSEL